MPNLLKFQAGLNLLTIEILVLFYRYVTRDYTVNFLRNKARKANSCHIYAAASQLEVFLPQTPLSQQTTRLYHAPTPQHFIPFYTPYSLLSLYFIIIIFGDSILI